MSLLLLSGGHDSTSLAWSERPQLAITVDYGQRPAPGEIRASREICGRLRIRHEVVTVPTAALGSGDLAGQPPAPLAPSTEWWPFRNQLLLTIAAMKAISIGASSILIGTVRSDAVHGDGRKEFLDSFNRLLASQEGQLLVRAPALEVETAELVRSSGVPRELLAWCHSCHVDEWACGACRGCQKALAVRVELGYEEV